MQEKARQAVLRYYNANHDAEAYISIGDVYIVWFSKTLQNWKALVSTNVEDGMYYEVTYNGDRREMYLDAYKKEQNVVIKDREV